MTRVAGLVLAGGSATRMGGVDKALLPLGAGTILDALLARLRPQVAMIALSANGDPTRFESVKLPVLPDGEAARGPLAGLFAGLRWAADENADALLTIPCDTPFIPRDLLARLGDGPACAANSAGTHHLVAVWPVTALELLEQFEARRVAAFARAIGMRAVWFADTPDPFFNINTRTDFEAVSKAGGRAPPPDPGFT